MNCRCRQRRPEGESEDQLLAKLTEVQAYTEAIRRIYDALRAPVRDIVKALVALAPYPAGFVALHQFVTLLAR